MAARVVTEELGAPPERVFLDWEPVPVAAASIGQVHRAVLRDGRVVAVKVQYPGVDRAIKTDLDNAELLYGLFAGFKLKNLDVKGLVDELRARMGDELDYETEARCQQEFANLYGGHPFIRVPSVVAEFSTRRVLTSEWVDGQRWEEFLASSSAPARQVAGEVIYRFSQESIHRYGVFNGDPHPGNYRFHDDGSVTFLDFGLVKRWSPGEFDGLTPVLDALLAHDEAGTVSAMVGAGFPKADHGFDPAYVWDYVSTPYTPLLSPRFTYTRAWVASALEKILDLKGQYSDLIATLNMPTSFVILDRVVWGVSGLLGRLEAENGWAGIVAEYRKGAPPSPSSARWKSGGASAVWRPTGPANREERVRSARSGCRTDRRRRPAPRRRPPRRPVVPRSRPRLAQRSARAGRRPRGRDEPYAPTGSRSRRRGGCVTAGARTSSHRAPRGWAAWERAGCPARLRRTPPRPPRLPVREALPAVHGRFR